MSIQVKCPNANCGKVVDVKEEHAARTALCKACGTRIPIAGGDVTVNPIVPVSGGAGFWGTIESRSLALQLDNLSRNLFGGAILSLFLLILSTFFKWISISFGNLSVGASGISAGEGKLVLVCSLVVGVFAVVAFFSKPEWFTYSVYAGAAWGGLSFLWLTFLLLRAGSFAGFGLYLAVLATLGVAGTFGFLAFQAAKKAR